MSLLSRFFGKQTASAIEAKTASVVEAVTATSEFGWVPVTSVWSPATSPFRDYDARSLAEVMIVSSIVRACVSELSSGVASGRLTVGVETPDGFEEHEHDALDLFYRNPAFSYSDILSLFVSRLQLTGISYALLENRLLTPIPTHLVKPIIKGTRVISYRMGTDTIQNLEPDEVVSAMYRDPSRMWGFLSPLATAVRELQIDLQRQELTAEWMRNKNLPGGFLQFGKDSPSKNLTKEQADQLRDSLTTATGAGTSSRGKFAVLPGGLQFAPGMDISDIDMSVMTGLAESRICMAFQVPPIIIGAKVGLDRSTFSN